MVSLSMTAEEQWETKVRLDPGFDRIEMGDKGIRTAFDVDGDVLDTFIPDRTLRKMPINPDNMHGKEQLIGTPDGEMGITENNPNTQDIRVDPGHAGLNPLVPYSDRGMY